jgi:tetratricopeptide (TPR) repeat protein
MNVAAQLALLYCDQARWQDAADSLVYGEEFDRSPPPAGKVYVFMRLAARARIAAHAGNHAEAVELARTAVELAVATGPLLYQAWMWLALAQAARAGGNHAEADEAVEQALELYDRKGNTVAAARVRASAP